MTDRQIKVLLIEDNPGDARLIEEMLSEVSGTLFDMETAGRLSDGLTRIQKGGIDAVLLDLGLPDSTGLDTFKTVYDRAPEVPIVMLTGLDDTKLALEGMRMGAQDYLVKGRADGDLLARTLRYAIERKTAEARIEHLNSVLNAIRNVNQLIVTETGRVSLLRKSCDALVDARGYDAVWLGFLGDDGTFDLVVGSGFREDIKHFSDRVAGGDHPPCIREALRGGEKVLVPDKSRACEGCFFKDVYRGKEALIARVEHADRFFGLLAVLLAPGVAVDEEEKGLLAEVASDIGIALHNREIAKARKVAEDALFEGERKYSEFFRTSRDPVFITSEEGRLVESNDALTEVLGYETMGELLKIDVPEHYENPEDKKRFNRIIEQQGFAKEFPANLRKKDGGIINTLITATMLKDGDGNMAGIQGTIRDITDRKAAEDALLESKSRYKRLYSMVRLMCDNLPDLIWTKDLESNFIFVNEACCDILLNAVDTDEPIGKDEVYFAMREKVSHPENPDYHTFGEACTGSDLIVIETKKPQRFDEFGNLKGEFVYLDVYKAPFWDEEHNLLGTVGCARVVTKERRAEEQIRRSLQEKEVMLREIHHRVKNNLQVVSSLLNMQARNAGDKNTIEIISEARNRIITMSLIHSQLYEGSDLAEINMKEFINQLLGQLRSYTVGEAKIVSVVRVDDYPFPISVAVPVGLIINELLSNALKHAFEGRNEGKIEVSLTASEGGGINLAVGDDGVGLPPGFDIDESKTLGLRLVKILTEDQLQGNIEVISEEGVTFLITFGIGSDYGEVNSHGNDI